MNLHLETPSRRNPARIVVAARPKRALRRDPAADVHAFADRLLYDGWLEDNRRDQLKLHLIRAIVEWAHGGAGR